MATTREDAVAAVERLRLKDKLYSPLHRTLQRTRDLDLVDAELIADDLELIGDFILGLSSEQADGSTFKKLFDQFSNGGEFSVETREVDGDFQQRAVLKGVWESAEKPSGLS